MCSLKSVANKYLPFFLTQVVILVIGLNTISCNCNNPKIGEFDKNVNLSSEEENRPIDLTLSSSSNHVIKGTEPEPIQLKITNKGTQSTVVGKLRLKVTRIEGSHASIDGAADQGSGKYEIELGTVSAKGIISQDLTILPGLDIKATFKFKLIYEGYEVGNSLDVRWEKGAWVEIGVLRYNPNTKHLTCDTIVNTGSEIARQVKLRYKIKRTGAAGLVDETVYIANNLAPGEKIGNQDLGPLKSMLDSQSSIWTEVLFYEEGNKEQFRNAGIAESYK